MLQELEQVAARIPVALNEAERHEWLINEIMPGLASKSEADLEADLKTCKEIIAETEAQEGN